MCFHDKDLVLLCIQPQHNMHHLLYIPIQCSHQNIQCVRCSLKSNQIIIVPKLSNWNLPTWSKTSFTSVPFAKQNFPDLQKSEVAGSKNDAKMKAKRRTATTFIFDDEIEVPKKQFCQNSLLLYQIWGQKNALCKCFFSITTIVFATATPWSVSESESGCRNAKLRGYSVARFKEPNYFERRGQSRSSPRFWNEAGPGPPHE